MPSKRPSDSNTYFVLSKITSTFIYLILVYYAARKVIDISSKHFFIQSTIIDVTPMNPLVPFPDVMICAAGEVKIIISPKGGLDRKVNATIKRYDLAGMTDIVKTAKTPCFPYHKTLNIASMNGAWVRGVRDSAMLLQIDPIYASDPSVTYKNLFATVLVIPFEGNPYYNLDELPVDQDNFPRGLLNNYYTVPQDKSVLEIHAVPKATQTIREDIWGLFGQLNDDWTHSVSTTANMFPYINASRVKVFRPTVYLNESQVLITSIPSALSDLGGAISLFWGIYYMLFGAPRIDAFGKIAACCLRQKTQKKLTEEYGYWESKPALTNSSKPSSGTSPACSTSAPQDLLPSNEPSDQKDHIHSELKVGEGDLEPNLGQEKHVCPVEDRFNKLDKLLREYFLEMDLASAADTESDKSQRWRFWKRKPDDSHDKKQA